MLDQEIILRALLGRAACFREFSELQVYVIRLNPTGVLYPCIKRVFTNLPCVGGIKYI